MPFPDIIREGSFVLLELGSSASTRNIYLVPITKHNYLEKDSVRVSNFFIACHCFVLTREISKVFRHNLSEVNKVLKQLSLT